MQLTNLSAPLHIDFDLTGRCQLNCHYCSAMPLVNPDADTNKTIQLLNELKHLEVFSLLISGGEPTLHRNFLSVMEVAASSIPSVTFNTNGIRLSKINFCKELENIASNVLVAISLDSVDHKINDIYRGKGGRQAITAIENSIESGLTVCVSSVLTDISIPHVTQIIKRFWPFVKQFRFFPIVPRSESDLLNISRDYNEHINKVIHDLSILALDYPGIHIFTPLGDVASKFWQPNESKCLCSHTRLYINSKFEVFPCFYSATPKNLIGSLHDHSLIEIWKSKASREIINPCKQQHSLIPSRYIDG